MGAVPTPMTRTAAESHCAQFGGHLASIHSLEDNDKISDFCRALTPNDLYNNADTPWAVDACWIGLKAPPGWDGTGTNVYAAPFAWDDGSAWDYQNFIPLRGRISWKEMWLANVVSFLFNQAALASVESENIGLFLHVMRSNIHLFATLAPVLIR